MAFGPLKADGSGSFLVSVAGFGAFIVILAVGASLWIGDRAEKQALAAKSGRVVYSQNIRSVLDDPMITGSIAGAAGATRLDPCASPNGRR